MNKLSNDAEADESTTAAFLEVAEEIVIAIGRRGRSSVVGGSGRCRPGLIVRDEVLESRLVGNEGVEGGEGVHGKYD